MRYKTFTYTLILLLSISIVFGLNQVSIPGINREDVGGVTYIVLNNITNNFTNTNYTSSIGFSRVGGSVTLNLERVGMGNLTASFTDQTSNGSAFDQTLNTTSDVLFNNLNVTNTLTVFGGLVVDALTLANNITPATNNIYNLGNTSLWWNKAYIRNIYSENINASNINATNLYSGFLRSTGVNSTNINSEVVNVDNNLSIGGYRIIKEGNDLVVII